MASDHVRHPAPINQFYRLDYDDKTRTWRKTTQWGTSHDSVNCMAAEGAVAIDAETGGTITSTPPQIRSHQDDQSGGIGVDDINVAWNRLWGKTFLTPDDFNWSDTIAQVRARRHVTVGVDYRYVPDAYQLQSPGNFDHAIGIDDIRDTDQYILIYDSLGTRARWLPQYAVRNAAEALARRVRGTAQRLFVGMTKVRPSIVPIPATWHAVLHPTKPATKLAFFEYHLVKNSAGIWIVDKPPKGRQLDYTGGTSSDCSAPHTYAWPGHNPPTHVSLVKLYGTTDHKGDFVQAKFARPK